MSVYFNGLSSEVKARYLSKISLINNVDPYDCDESALTRDLYLFPPIELTHIDYYFTHTTSAYTYHQFKAYKSLESYMFSECGWVRDIRVRKFGDNTLILGKVMQSQRIQADCLQPWIIAKEDGDILCGHCTCTAGLSEACSHVGALLFSVCASKPEERSITDVEAQWTVPHGDVGEPMPLSKILIQTTKIKKRAKKYPPLTQDEFHNLLRAIKDSGVASPLLDITAPFCFEED